MPPLPIGTEAQRGNLTQRFGIVSFGPGNKLIANSTITTARSNSSKASQRYQNVIPEDEDEFKAAQMISKKERIFNNEGKL